MNTTLPAGPKQSPVRQLIEMGANPFALLDRCRREYGDVFTLRIFGQGPFVLIGESEAVRWIFSSGPPAAEGTLTGLTQPQSDQVREAAMFCPPEAITVLDAETGEQYYP